MLSRTVPLSAPTIEVMFRRGEIWTITGTCASAYAVSPSIRSNMRNIRRPATLNPLSLLGVFGIQCANDCQVRKIDLQAEVPFRYIGEMKFSRLVDGCAF